MPGKRHPARLLLVLATGLCAWPPPRPHAATDSWIEDFIAGPLNQDGSPSNVAAARPYELTNGFDINEIQVPKPPGVAPQENLKSVSLVLPPGNIANAAAYPRCPQAKFPVSCGKDTIIGTVTVSAQFLERGTLTEPVYNLDPPPGMPLQFGFASSPRTSTSTSGSGTGPTTGRRRNSSTSPRRRRSTPRRCGSGATRPTPATMPSGAGPIRTPRQSRCSPTRRSAE